MSSYTRAPLSVMPKRYLLPYLPIAQKQKQTSPPTFVNPFILLVRTFRPKIQCDVRSTGNDFRVTSFSADFCKEIMVYDNHLQEHSVEDRTDYFSLRNADWAGISDCSVRFLILDVLRIGVTSSVTVRWYPARYSENLCTDCKCRFRVKNRPSSSVYLRGLTPTPPHTRNVWLRMLQLGTGRGLLQGNKGADILPPCAGMESRQAPLSLSAHRQLTVK